MTYPSPSLLESHPVFKTVSSGNGSNDSSGSPVFNVLGPGISTAIDPATAIVFWKERRGGRRDGDGCLFERRMLGSGEVLGLHN